MTAQDPRTVVVDACEALDRQRFNEFLALCDNEFRYRITSYSPDIRKELVLMDQNREEMGHLFAALPGHVRMPGQFLRHVAAGRVAPNDASSDRVTTQVAIYYTELSGITRLFAVGRYDDVVSHEGRLRQRVLRLDTRELSPGCHVPL